MSEFNPSSMPERNPVTYRIHRKEVLRRITLPFSIAALIILAMALLTVLVGSLDVSKLADVALIWLIVPAMGAGLIFLAILGAMVFGIIWLVRNVPIFTRKAQAFFISVSSAIKKFTGAIVEPFIRLQSISAAVRAILRR